MAVDSIMARPTNNVLVMVDDASGCCASELNADATAFPSLNAGNIQPIPVVNPAVIIDAMAMVVVLSMMILLYFFVINVGCCFFFTCTAPAIYTVARMLKI